VEAIFRDDERILGAWQGALSARSKKARHTGSDFGVRRRIAETTAALHQVAGVLLLPAIASVMLAAGARTPASKPAQHYAVDIKAAGAVPALSQAPKERGCWATAAAMLLSWRYHRRITPRDAARMAGPSFVAAWDSDAGLLGKDKDILLRRLGLVTEAPQDFLVRGWIDLVRDHAPLWVTTAETFDVHARIVTRIYGDGREDGKATYLVMIDPIGARRITESIAHFTRKFDTVGYADLSAKVPFRPQIVHF
jgi:hypothetical protein